VKIKLLGLLALSFPIFGATITVTNTNDSGSGSLRNAIAIANHGDTISFSVAGTISLTTGTLSISKDLIIDGPGASSLAIRGNNTFQVFSIAATVVLSGLTVENGSSSGGGGIFNAGALTLSNSTVSHNSAAYGGGIFNVGTLTLTNSNVSGNSSAYAGGGINNHGGLVTLTNSTISGNFTLDGGGGVFNDYGSLTLTSSVVSRNSATNAGGGIYNAFGTLTLTNSAVTGNSASRGGGGILNSGTGTVTNSTVSGNTGGIYGGGGIYHVAYALTLTNSTISGNSTGIRSQATLTLKNTIVANSGSGANCSFEFDVDVSDGHNLSDDSTCSSFLTAIGDLNNTPAELDPNGLQYNGGPTQTIALLPGSPAVDAIPVTPNNFCTAIDAITPVATDQRGIPRPQGYACDIGAFELYPHGFTPTGSDVFDQPTDATEGGTPVTLTFSTVTQAGNTTLTTTSGGPPPPTGFKLGSPPMYYNLNTTAAFSGTLTVCVNYAGTTFGNPSKLQLFHYENNAWIDVTTSVDTTTRAICGTVNSLSPFAIFESAYAASIQPPINGDGSSIFAASRGVIPVKFTLTLNGTITCQLPPATISLTRTTGDTTGVVNESSFSMQSDSGLNFRIDIPNCQYAYNLGASTLGKGMYSVQIMSGNVIVGGVSFGLK